MFCMSFGKSCVSNAKYCHSCGKHLSESTAKEESIQNKKGQSSGGDAEVIEATSGRMSSAQFKALKEKIWENISPERMGKSQS